MREFGASSPSCPSVSQPGQEARFNRAGGIGVLAASRTVRLGCWHAACMALHGAACSPQCSEQSHTGVAPSPTALGLRMSTQGCCSAPLLVALQPPSPRWAHGKGSAPSWFLLSADPNNSNCLPGLHA